MYWRVILLLIIFALQRAAAYFFWSNQTVYTDGFFTVIKNPDIAFSLPVPMQIILPLAVILLIFIGRQMIIDFRLKLGRWFFWGLIFVGAVSNLLDRLRYGAVIDYFNLSWWPVFNLADSGIVLAVIFLLLTEARKKPLA